VIELRNWADDDAEWYVQQGRDPEILRFTTEPASLTVAEFLRALEGLRHNGNALGFVAVDAGSGARLANVAAARHGAVAEVSYWVAAEARGRGVASRALKLLCENTAASWPGIEIRLWTYADNTASGRVAENAGFTRMPAPAEKPAGDRPVRWYRKLVEPAEPAAPTA
jgi:ribosomal-protein-alanine N-acetyltransferase